MKLLQSSYVIRISFVMFLLISCQKSEATFDGLTKFLKTELIYNGTLQHQNLLIINLNTCSFCIERIAKDLQDLDKKSNLLLVISANTQKEIDYYLNVHHLSNKFKVVADLKSGLFNQPFFDGSAGYFFKVSDNKIEKTIRFDINHNFESFEKELLTIE